MLTRTFCIVFMMALSSAIVATGCAAEDAPVNAKVQHLGPLAGKIDPKLIPALDALHSGTATSAAMSRGMRSSIPRAQSLGATDKIVLNLDVPNVTDAVLKEITATGAQVLHSSARWNDVSVAASIDSIDALTRVPGIRSIRIAYKPAHHQQGIAPNQADGSMKADQARLATGTTGAGQKIGVISDTINRTAAVGAGIVTGTVPNAILTQTTPQLTGDLLAQGSRSSILARTTAPARMKAKRCWN